MQKESFFIFLKYETSENENGSFMKFKWFFFYTVLHIEFSLVSGTTWGASRDFFTVQLTTFSYLAGVDDIKTSKHLGYQNR